MNSLPAWIDPPAGRLYKLEKEHRNERREPIMSLLDRLDKASVHWERQFCEFGGGTAYISFQREHPHALGYKQYQARLYVLVDGVWKHKIFKPSGTGQSVPEKRRDCVEAAQEWARERLGGPEWVPGPFPDSWQTRETRERALARLDEMSGP